ncbi:MAG TPA: hypothetical protein VK213_04060 [Bacteroidales bacterium]|nr:hypothetical protein [Bacteroidales bacterium]
MIVYLLVKGFIRSLYLEDPPEAAKKKDEAKGGSSKRISKNIGEYTDFEEVD